MEAARVIFSGVTERDREAAINSVISSTLCLCSQFCDAIHSRNDQQNLSKAHVHAFLSMIDTHDELEREPLTLGTLTEYVTNQLGSPAETESVPADVCEWAATFVTEAPSLVENEITSPDLVFAALLQINFPQILDSFDLLLPLSPTHGVANNVERYSVKPGPHVRASRPSTQSVASK